MVYSNKPHLLYAIIQHWNWKIGTYKIKFKLTKSYRKFLLYKINKLLKTVTVTFLTNSPVRSIVTITLSTMLRQFLTSITSAFKRKYFQTIRAQVTIEQLMFLSHVFLKLLEGAERPTFLIRVFTVAYCTSVFQQTIVSLLDALSGKMDAKSAILQVSPL